MDLISIVIPTYNRPELLKRAVESVLKQSYTNYELFIVNDSDDEDTVKKVIQGFNDNRIQYCRNSRTKGGNGARNTGILKAKGKYIALLDDDDEWLPRKLEDQIDKLRSLDPSWGGCYCGYIIFENSKWRNVFNLRQVDIIRYFLLSRNPVCAGSTLLFAKSVVAQIGLFDEKLERHQDILFLVRFLRYYKLAFVDKIHVKIYGHSRPSAEKLERAKLMLLEKIKPDISRLNIKDINQYYALQYCELAVLFSSKGNIEKTRYYLKRSIAHKILFPIWYMSIFLNLIYAKTHWNLPRYFQMIKSSLKKSKISYRLLRRII